MVKTAAAAILQRGISLVAFGAILVSVSEFWFYELGEDVGSVLILLVYSLRGDLFLVVIQRFRVRNAAGLTVAAALLGFFIEGVSVPVVYANSPLSIVWTSLAWHALITVGLGRIAFRWTIARCSTLKAATFNAALGLFLGVWNAYMWNAREVGAAGEVTFDLQPVGTFIGQFLFGYVLYLGGHFLFDRFYPRDVTFTRAEHLSLWGLAGAVSLVVAFDHGPLAQYPVLLILLAICVLALHHARPSHTPSHTTIVDELYTQKVTLWRFTLTGFIPLFPLPTYAVLVTLEIGIEMNAVIILTAGPVASIMLFCAFLALYRQRKAAL